MAINNFEARNTIEYNTHLAEKMTFWIEMVAWTHLISFICWVTYIIL